MYILHGVIPCTRMCSSSRVESLPFSLHDAYAKQHVLLLCGLPAGVCPPLLLYDGCQCRGSIETSFLISVSGEASSGSHTNRNINETSASTMGVLKLVQKEDPTFLFQVRIFPSLKANRFALEIMSSCKHQIN